MNRSPIFTGAMTRVVAIPENMTTGMTMTITMDLGGMSTLAPNI